MGFKGITDEQIKRGLEKEVGVVRPGAKDYLLDALGFAPALLGMPIISPVPTKSTCSFKAARFDDRILRRVKSWLMGKGKKPPAPGVIFRGIPKGAEPKMRPDYTHGTPWKSVAAGGGKGGFGDPRSHDIYAYSSSPDTLLYRGGSLAGDPLESTGIMSAQGITWDKALDKTRGIYKKQLARIPGFNEYGRVWAAEKAANDLMMGTFEADIGNKPGIWRQKIVPKELRRERPMLRRYDELEEIVNKARAAGMTEAEIAELPESIILKRR